MSCLYIAVITAIDTHSSKWAQEEDKHNHADGEPCEDDILVPNMNHTLFTEYLCHIADSTS